VGKGPEAFRTISEVAEDLDVPKHVLRFWETKFTQVKPMKRGGGRRYYRPEDVELLRGIRVLLHDEGYTIRGLQKMFRQQGVNYIKTYPHKNQPSAHTPRSAAQGVPDVAGEAADYARKAAMERAKTPASPARQARSGHDKRRDRKRSPRPRQDAPANAGGLTPRQHEALKESLAELEECRRLLTRAPSTA